MMSCKAGRTFKPVDGESPAGYSEQKYVQFDRKEHVFCWGLCCVQGCLMGVLALVIIFIILPAGLLMIFHGSNKDNKVTLSAGICLLAFPFVFVFPALLAHRWRHRVLKEKVAHKRMTKTKYEYKNDSEEIELDTAC